jgi:hypothetical protein
MLITGSHQYDKHKAVIQYLDKNHKNIRVLFRTNSMAMVKEHLNAPMSATPKAGQTIKIGNNKYEFDAFTSRVTWHHSSNKFAAVIVYPIDPIARKSLSLESIEDLYSYKTFQKIFFISWTDNKDNDYSIFDKYIDRKCTFDAEEEDQDYHKRVIDIINDHRHK